MLNNDRLWGNRSRTLSPPLRQMRDLIDQAYADVDEEDGDDARAGAAAVAAHKELVRGHAVRMSVVYEDGV